MIKMGCIANKTDPAPLTQVANDLQHQVLGALTDTTVPPGYVGRDAATGLPMSARDASGVLATIWTQTITTNGVLGSTLWQDTESAIEMFIYHALTDGNAGDPGVVSSVASHADHTVFWAYDLETHADILNRKHPSQPLTVAVWNIIKSDLWGWGLDKDELDAWWAANSAEPATALEQWIREYIISGEAPPV